MQQQQQRHCLRRPYYCKHPTDIVYCEPTIDNGLVVLRSPAMVYWTAVLYLPDRMLSILSILPRCTADLRTIDVTQRCPDTKRQVVIVSFNGVDDQHTRDRQPIEYLYMIVKYFIARYVTCNELSTSAAPPLDLRRDMNSRY